MAGNSYRDMAKKIMEEDEMKGKAPPEMEEPPANEDIPAVEMSDMTDGGIEAEIMERIETIGPEKFYALSAKEAAEQLGISFTPEDMQMWESNDPAGREEMVNAILDSGGRE